jgi:hypothetical protein
MHLSLPTRIASTLATLALCLTPFAHGFMQAQSHRPTAMPQVSAAPETAGSHLHAANVKAGQMKASGDHLAEWMNRHSTLNPDQQQRALENEPGFHDLPPQTQQRMRDTLIRLNAMPPEKRERLLERNEAMEHLTLSEREQVRSAMKQLADLPPDQRRYVARTFRGLRELAPAQRQAVLNSERFNHLTDAQRASLNSLMQVEPLLPPPYDAGIPTPAGSTQASVPPYTH